AGDEQAIRLVAALLAGVLHAHAEARGLAVEGAGAVDLHRIRLRQNGAARIAHGTEQRQVLEVDLDAGILVVQLEAARERATAAVAARGQQAEVLLALARLQEATAVHRSAHAGVVLRIRELQDAQPALVPAGVDEA